jgi:hypothetical protein
MFSYAHSQKEEEFNQFAKTNNTWEKDSGFSQGTRWPESATTWALTTEDDFDNFSPMP